MSENLIEHFSYVLAGTRPIVTRTVRAPTTKPAPPIGNLQKLPLCDKCGNGIVLVQPHLALGKSWKITCMNHNNIQYLLKCIV